MLTIEKQPYGLGNPEIKGDYIRLGHTPDELVDHLKTIKQGQFGWLETNTKGLNLHFVGDSDGLGARFTDGKITNHDCVYTTRLYGEHAVKLLTRHHTICD